MKRASVFLFQSSFLGPFRTHGLPGRVAGIYWGWALHVHGLTGSAGEHRSDRTYTSQRGARQAAQRYAKGLGIGAITFADTATIAAVSGAQR